MSIISWTSARVCNQDHPPITQIAALLNHVQDVGLSAGAGQTREEEDSGPGGGIGMREALVVVKPIHGYLPSICCLNKLAAEMSGTQLSGVALSKMDLPTCISGTSFFLLQNNRKAPH